MPFVKQLLEQWAEHCATQNNTHQAHCSLMSLYKHIIDINCTKLRWSTFFWQTKTYLLTYRPVLRCHPLCQPADEKAHCGTECFPSSEGFWLSRNSLQIIRDICHMNLSLFGGKKHERCLILVQQAYLGFWTIRRNKTSIGAYDSIDI